MQTYTHTSMDTNICNYTNCKQNRTKILKSINKCVVTGSYFKRFRNRTRILAIWMKNHMQSIHRANQVPSDNFFYNLSSPTFKPQILGGKNMLFFFASNFFSPRPTLKRMKAMATVRRSHTVNDRASPSKGTTLQQAPPTLQFLRYSTSCPAGHQRSPPNLYIHLPPPPVPGAADASSYQELGENRYSTVTLLRNGTWPEKPAKNPHPTKSLNSPCLQQ